MKKRVWGKLCTVGVGCGEISRDSNGVVSLRNPNKPNKIITFSEREFNELIAWAQLQSKPRLGLAKNITYSYYE